MNVNLARLKHLLRDCRVILNQLGKYDVLKNIYDEHLRQQEKFNELTQMQVGYKRRKAINFEI